MSRPSRLLIPTIKVSIYIRLRYRCFLSLLFPFLMHIVPRLTVISKCPNLPRVRKWQHLHGPTANNHIRLIPISLQLHILQQAGIRYIGHSLQELLDWDITQKYQ